jgi:uncharacterized damage-inducible protein DinB
MTMIDDTCLVEFHSRSRDAIRAVLTGLDESQLHERDPQRGFSIAEEVGHLIAAEHFFLSQDCGLDPGFPPFNREKGQAASGEELRDCLSQIDKRWPELLRDHPDRPELRAILTRMALHTLYHLVKAVDRRERMEPQFKLPHWSQPGSWEHAIEPVLEAIGG